MYSMLVNYGTYKEGQRLVIVDEGVDWFRTNKGIYIPKNLTSWVLKYENNS